MARRPGQVRWLPRWWRDHDAMPWTLRLPPWPYEAMVAVAGRLRPRDRAFGFGVDSVLWLEGLGAEVTCVEHRAEWCALLSPLVAGSTTLSLVEPELTGLLRSSSMPGFFDLYVDRVRSQPDASFDVVVVEGRARVACAVASADKIRPGGILVLADPERDGYRAVHDRFGDWPSTTHAGLTPGGGVASVTIWANPARPGRTAAAGHPPARGDARRRG